MIPSMLVHPLHRKIKFWLTLLVSILFHLVKTKKISSAWERLPLVKQQKFLKTHVASLLLKSWQLANLDLKPENHELGKGTKPAYDMIRSKVAFIEFDKDIEIFEELNKASAVVESEEFLATIEKAVDLSIQY